LRDVSSKRAIGKLLTFARFCLELMPEGVPVMFAPLVFITVVTRASPVFEGVSVTPIAVAVDPEL